MPGVGLIGFGEIGRSVARLLAAGLAGDQRIVGVCVRSPANYERDAEELGIPFVTDIAALIGLRPSVVVEVAGPEAVRDHVADVLSAGIDVLVIGVGALADAAVRQALLTAAAAGPAQLRVVSGATGGLDMLGAAALLGIDTVEHTLRKPPRALLDDERASAVERDGVPLVVFEGSAGDAARMFPKNANVLAAVGLAGLGPDQSRARVIADPHVNSNIQELEVRGQFGSMRLAIDNVPGPSGRSAIVVAPSIVRALRDRSALLVLG